MLTCSLSTPSFSPSTFYSPCSLSCEPNSTFFYEFYKRVSRLLGYPSHSYAFLHQPFCPVCVKTKPLRSKNVLELKSRSFVAERHVFAADKSRKMTVTIKCREEKEPLLDTKMNSGPMRIALFVEPSPFAYVSGYKNRFQNFIKYLREIGDEVLVVTTHEGIPQEFYGAHLIGSRSFPCPYYEKVPLSLALSPRIISAVAQFKPDIIHASSPGIMVFGALAIAKLLSVPIVMSYHTHVPVYIPRYTFSLLVKPMWLIINMLGSLSPLLFLNIVII